MGRIFSGHRRLLENGSLSCRETIALLGNECNYVAGNQGYAGLNFFLVSRGVCLARGGSILSSASLAAQIVMLVLMVCFTCLGLWLLSAANG